eukprot:3457117-Rhodomonas_salina.1
MFQETVSRAAQMLGISTTALKTACRRVGIQSWSTTVRMDVLTEGGRRTLSEPPSSPSDTCYIADSCTASERSGRDTAPELSSEDEACEEESARTKEQCNDGSASPQGGEGITEEDKTTSVWAWSEGEASWEESICELQGLFEDQYGPTNDWLGPEALAPVVLR